MGLKICVHIVRTLARPDVDGVDSGLPHGLKVDIALPFAHVDSVVDAAGGKGGQGRRRENQEQGQEKAG